MYDLFAPPTHSGGGLVIPQMDRVRRGLQDNIRRIQTFYRNNPRTLGGSHFLVRLMGSLNISHQQPDDIFTVKVGDWALDLSMSLKMTSSIFRGKLFDPGVFYGEGVKEIIIAHCDPFDINHASANWKDLTPIRVLYHPFCDLNMTMLNGKGEWDGNGIAVIAINIPMLALQYKCWRRWERTVNHDSPQSVMQFLHALPIPNAMTSHVNHAIFNRMVTRYFDGALPQPRRAHSFYLTDWTDEVDDAVDYYLKFIRGKRLTFDQLIDYVPQVDGSYHDAIALPDEAYTMQLQWGIVLARVTLLTFLVQFNADEQSSNNRLYLNALQRYLKRIAGNKLMFHMLPQEDYEQLQFVINDGIAPYL